MSWQGITDVLYAAKAYIAGVFVAGNTVYQLVVQALADENISFSEAEIIWTAAGGLVAALLTIGAVFQTKNKEVPT